MPQIGFKPFMGRTMRAAAKPVKTQRAEKPVPAALTTASTLATKLTTICPDCGKEPSALNVVAFWRDKANVSCRSHRTRGWDMSFETTRKSVLHLELQPVEASGEDAGMRVYVLLPTLEELLGEPTFGRRDPIFLPGHERPLDGWALFGSLRDRGVILH
jgi:hypothetical protein